MSKKIFAILMAGAIVSAMFVGCGKKNPSSATEPHPDDQTQNGTQEATDPTQTTQYVGPDSTTPTVSAGVEEWEEESSTGTTTTQPTTPPPATEQNPEGLLAYEIYLSWPTSKQQQFFRSFADPDAFFVWLEDAEAEYEEKQKGNAVTGGGSIDLKNHIEQFEKDN